MSRWPVGQKVHLKLHELAGSTKTMKGVASGMTVSSAVRPSRLIRGSSRAFMRVFLQRAAPAQCPIGQWLTGINQTFGGVAGAAERHRSGARTYKRSAECRRAGPSDCLLYTS